METTLTQNTKPIYIWLLTGCVMIYMMVVIGAITRLTGSGLSITEWKVITGTVPPFSEDAWQKEFDAYKQTPQFKIINSDFTLSDFKDIYWWEYIHRFLGRTIGVVFIIPFLFFLIKKKFPEGFLKKMGVLLFLGGLQGFLGWFMVKSGLEKNPHVSHFRLAIHLVSAFTVFAFTLWYALDLRERKSDSTINPQFKKWVIISFVVLTIQIIYGAFVAGLKAGLAYPTFPLMGDKLIADEVFAYDSILKSLTEGIAGVQFVHRYTAYVVAGLIIFLFVKSKKENLSNTQREIVKYLFYMVIIQFTLGVLTLLMHVPITIAVLHQTGAFVLFSLFVILLHSINKKAHSN